MHKTGTAPFAESISPLTVFVLRKGCSLPTMATGPSNSTVVFETLVSAPFSFLSNVYSAAVSILPVKFSLVQQVHVKLKAEATVMFAFCFLKQVYASFKSWRVKRETRRLEAVKEVAKKEKKRKRRNRGRKRQS